MIDHRLPFFLFADVGIVNYRCIKYINLHLIIFAYTECSIFLYEYKVLRIEISYY